LSVGGLGAWWKFSGSLDDSSLSCTDSWEGRARRQAQGVLRLSLRESLGSAQQCAAGTPGPDSASDSPAEIRDQRFRDPSALYHRRSAAPPRRAAGGGRRRAAAATANTLSSAPRGAQHNPERRARRCCAAAAAFLWVLSCWVESFGFDDFVYVIMILFILHDLFCFRLAAAIYMHHADQSMNHLVGAAGSGKARKRGWPHHSTHIAATRPPAARSAGECCSCCWLLISSLHPP
jgi:hypothetical protein